MRAPALSLTLALAALALGSVLGSACGGSDPSEKVADLAASLDRPLDRLDEAVAEASPADAASLVALRAAADRAVEDLDDAEDELRKLDSDAARDDQVQAFEEAVDANRELAESLAEPRLNAATIAGLTQAADATSDDLIDAELPSIETAELVAELRTAARRRRTGRVQPSGGTAQTTPSIPSVSTARPSFRQHAAFGYQARIPTGPGWSEPADSQPTPGRLFRTSIRGPSGMFVIIDYTPQEPAVFGGSYEARRSVGQTAFGQATEYVFQGGRLPECQRSRCVDYIVNDPASQSGFGVLAGGSDLPLAQDIAGEVMESLTPQATGE